MHDSSLQYVYYVSRQGELSVYGHYRGGVCLFPMYRITLYQYTGFRSLWLEVLYYGGAIPARTSPPEGGLRSWPNERPGDSSSAGGREIMVPQSWGGGGGGIIE